MLVSTALPAYAQDKSIIVASTTSTQDSGLFEYLLPSLNKRQEQFSGMSDSGRWTGKDHEEIEVFRRRSCSMELRAESGIR
jgi:ABC-type tungstate transport system permease subunit